MNTSLLFESVDTQVRWRICASRASPVMGAWGGPDHSAALASAEAGIGGRRFASRPPHFA